MGSIMNKSIEQALQKGVISPVQPQDQPQVIAQSNTPFQGSGVAYPNGGNTNMSGGLGGLMGKGIQQALQQGLISPVQSQIAAAPVSLPPEQNINLGTMPISEFAKKIQQLQSQPAMAASVPVSLPLEQNIDFGTGTFSDFAKKLQQLQSQALQQVLGSQSPNNQMGIGSFAAIPVVPNLSIDEVNALSPKDRLTRSLILSGFNSDEQNNILSQHGFANGGRVNYDNGGGVGLPPVDNYGQTIYNPDEFYFGPVRRDQISVNDVIKNDPRLNPQIQSGRPLTVEETMRQENNQRLINEGRENEVSPVIQGPGLKARDVKDLIKNYLQQQTSLGGGIGYQGSQYGLMGVKPFVGKDRSALLQGYYNTEDGSSLKGSISPRQQNINFGNTDSNGFNFSVGRDTYSGRPNYSGNINYTSTFKRGGYVSQGEPINTDLTRTIAPAKGPNPQGVETLFKRRYR